MGRKLAAAQADTTLSLNTLSTRYETLSNITPSEQRARGVLRKDILMARIDTAEHAHNSSLAIKPAWSTNNKYVLHFNLTHDGKVERKFSEHIATHNFAARYAALRFIEQVVGDERTSWINDNRLLVRDWFSVTLDDLSPGTLADLMEYTPTPAEKKWKLPTQYFDFAQRVFTYHRGSHPDISTRARANANLAPIEEPEMRAKGFRHPNERPPTSRALAPKPAPNKPERTPAPKLKPAATGIVTLAQLCTALKIDPRQARQGLRKAKTPKPSAGWQWPDEDAKRISAVIIAAVKALK